MYFSDGAIVYLCFEIIDGSKISSHFSKSSNIFYEKISQSLSSFTVSTKEKISCKTEFQAFDHLMKSVKNDADYYCILLSPTAASSSIFFHSSEVYWNHASSRGPGEGIDPSPFPKNSSKRKNNT